MATKQRHDRIGELTKDLEGAIKRLRADVRKRASGTALLKNLQAAANQLRKQAAAVVAQVEKYAHELRKELETAEKKPAPKRPRTTAKKKK